MAGKARGLCRGQRELTGEIWQRFQRRAHALVDLGAGVRCQAGALLDQGERRLGLQLAGAQQSRHLVKPSAQLEQGISHAHKIIERATVPGSPASEETALGPGT